MFEGMHACGLVQAFLGKGGNSRLRSTEELEGGGSRGRRIAIRRARYQPREVLCVGVCALQLCLLVGVDRFLHAG